MDSGGAEEKTKNSGDGGHDESLGVEPDPGEVEPDLDPEVLSDQPERLALVPVPQRGPFGVEELRETKANRSRAGKGTERENGGKSLTLRSFIRALFAFSEP